MLKIIIGFICIICSTVSCTKYFVSWEKNGNYDNYMEHLLWGWLSLMCLFFSTICTAAFIAAEIILYYNLDQLLFHE